jgi:hypothetical protein
MTMTTVTLIPPDPPSLYLSPLAAAMVGPTVVLNSCCQHPARSHSRLGCVGTIGRDLVPCRCGVTYRQARRWRS